MGGISMKRQNVLDWNTYFMALAHLSAERSKDPNTNVGAVIVDDMHRIVSIGYNGMPRTAMTMSSLGKEKGASLPQSMPMLFMLN